MSRYKVWPSLLFLPFLFSLLHQTRPVAPFGGIIFFVDSGQNLGNVDSAAAALGDLDGDSDLDAFVGNMATPSEVWLNQGVNSGTFQNSGQTIGDPLVLDVALGDLDGDNDLDAFVLRDASGDSNQVWINQGGTQGGTPGTFLSSGQTFGHDLSSALALADLDGDTDLDAYIVRNLGRPDKVWLNNGSGQFVDTNQALGADSSTGVALDDLDGDGDADAFVTLGAGNKVWLNQGGIQMGTPGVFQDSGQLLGNHLGQDVALDDLDGDEDVDALVAHDGLDQVWLNQGGLQGGTMGQFQVGQSLGNDNSREVILADLDLDGDADAFIANYGGNAVWVGQGDGTFISNGQSLGNASSEGVALGDVNGDSYLDAFVVNIQPNPANKVWLNQSNQTTIVGWQEQTLDVRGNVGQAVDMVLDSAGHPHISYYEQTIYSGRLKYAHWDGVNWHVELVDDSADVGIYTAITIDGQDRPHIGYHDLTNRDLKYATRGSQGWITETVVGTGADAGRQVDIAYNNVIHMSYVGGNGTLMHVQRVGGSWTVRTVDQSIVTSSPALAMDASGIVHISYYNNGLRYASFVANQWSSVSVHPGTGIGLHSELAFDVLGRPHLAYTDETFVYYGSLDGTTWTQETVMMVGEDRYFALAVDADSRPHISFYDTNDALQLAHRVGPNDWPLQPVAATGQGQFVALAYDTLAQPHLAYFDNEYDDLKYIVETAPWQISQVTANGLDSHPDQGLYQGKPFIAFLSATTSPPHLQLAHWQYPSWNPTNIDVTPQLNYDVGVEYDWNGTPHVAYYKNGAVRYATWDGSQWISETVFTLPTASVMGENLDLFMADTQPIIFYSFAHSGGITVEVAWPDANGNWTRQPLTLTGVTQLPAVFDVDMKANGDVVIVYQDEMNGILRLTRWNGNQWQFTTIATGVVASNAALVVARRHRLDGVPEQVAVVYHANQQLHYALSLDETYAAWNQQIVMNDLAQVDDLAITLAEHVATQPRIAYVDGSDNAIYLLQPATPNPGWIRTTLLEPGGESRTHLSLGYTDRERLTYQEGDEIYHLFRTANAFVPAEQQDIYSIDSGQIYSGGICAYNLSPGFFCSLFPHSFLCIDDDPDLVQGTVPGDAGVLVSLTALFRETSAGEAWVMEYAQFDNDIGLALVSEPSLMWDGYRTLQNFMPGLEALTEGNGSQVVVTQEMVNHAYSVWSRLAAAGSPTLAAAINSKLAQYNNLQDFVGMTFDEWAQAIGVNPPTSRAYLPVIVSDN